MAAFSLFLHGLQCLRTAVLYANRLAAGPATVHPLLQHIGFEAFGCYSDDKECVR
jgi:hypothetical protein